MDVDRDEPRHPMGVVTTRTGLSSHALRAWEKRYRVVRPGRSAGGHRLYSDRDVERLRMLHRLTLGGRRIGQLAGFSDDELASLLREDEAAGATAPVADTGLSAGNLSDLRDASLDAVRELDSDRLDLLLRRAVLGLDTMTYLDHLMAPLLREIGEVWALGEVTPAHEHVASAVVRRVGGWVLENLEAGDAAPTIVIGTPAGHRHELGALAAAIAAASAGWRVRYVGADLPAVDIGLAATGSEAAAVALSLVYPPADPEIARELRTLRSVLPDAIPIVVGGRAADTYGDTVNEIGALRLDSFEELRKYLKQFEG
jgi:DNA-binding transcriptional MerR regulator